MTLNAWIRRAHRWLSMAFALVVAVLVLLLGLGREPAPWAYVVPLAPLALMVATGLYLVALPHAARWRGRARAR